MSHAAWIRALALTACVLCLGVVVLGAYVRLSDAGLGCPDWPGCYGHLSPSGAAADVGAQERSGRPLEPGRAWREMAHRYAAATLVLLIVCLAATTVAWRRERLASPALTLSLVGVVIVQAIFGMLTVTWRLKPLIVTLHLLFGLTTLSLLWWLVLRLASPGGPWRHGAALRGSGPRAARILGLLALLAVALQIALGGWTSSNYAALACPDLPTCQGHWWPPADFRSAYTLSRDVSLDADAGGAGASALVAIHVTHRLGALLASAAVLAAAIAALVLRAEGSVRHAALALLALLGLQLTIGLTMVLRGFPLPLATAHNAGAALLLLGTLALNSSLRPAKPS
ncbi:MAG TPA: COX15/CtaA family protein [Steroidobacteraceae bacterium]